MSGWHLPSGTFTPDGGEGGCLQFILACFIFVMFVSWVFNGCDESVFKMGGSTVTSPSDPVYRPNDDSYSNYYNDSTYSKTEKASDVEPGVFNDASAENTFSKKLALEYYFLLNNGDIDQLAKEFLERFDKDYDHYLQDEFLLRDKINSAKDSLGKKLKTLVLDRIFDTVIRTQFSRYDFAKRCFHLIDFPSDNKMDIIIPGVPGLSIVFINFSEFDQDLALEENEARQLVAQKASDNWKTVYLKVFYSIENQSVKNDYERVLFARVSKVEVWADKQAVTWKLTEFLRNIPAPPGDKDLPEVSMDSASVETPDSFYRKQGGG